MLLSLLQPGDCLLYSPVGFFGWVIATKTWHHIAHVEVYAGKSKSWASRDGIGVGFYDFRGSQLAYVLRPATTFSMSQALEYAVKKRGTPYGWMELLNFVGLPVHNGGIFCSQFAVEFYRAGGWPMFPDDDAAAVAPFEFLNLVGSGFKQVIGLTKGSGS